MFNDFDEKKLNINLESEDKKEDKTFDLESYADYIAYDNKDKKKKQTSKPKEKDDDLLKILKFDTNKSKIKLRPLQEQNIIPAHPFRLLLVGRSGSGKSMNLVNLMTRPHMYGRTNPNNKKTSYFDIVFLFSPTADGGDDLVEHLDLDESKVITDEKTFYPVGSSTPIKSNFTLVSATCEGILEKVQRKEFREDLYFRLSGSHINLKPLNERIDDIDLLVKFFQKKSSRRFVIKPEALEALKDYAWPGNIRELSKVCERFSQSLTGIVNINLVKKTIIPHTTPVTAPQLHGWEEFVQNHGLRSYISHIEKRAVEEAMKRNNGKITASIKELKISSSAFYRILQDHQLTF